MDSVVLVAQWTAVSKVRHYVDVYEMAHSGHQDAHHIMEIIDMVSDPREPHIRFWVYARPCWEFPKLRLFSTYAQAVQADEDLLISYGWEWKYNGLDPQKADHRQRMTPFILQILQDTARHIMMNDGVMVIEK